MIKVVAAILCMYKIEYRMQICLWNPRTEQHRTCDLLFEQLFVKEIMSVIE
jgi:hypothetical protein